MIFALSVLATLTVLRFAVAALVPLSPDEAYYWIWSRALAPGYLDHPPMVALWIRAGTALAGDGLLGVRVLAPAAAAAGSVLLARAAADLLPNPASAAGRPGGRVAAGLLNATLILAVGSVTLSPDTPLLLFWTATLCALGRFVRTRRGAWLLAAGLGAGLALDSKYTAIFLAGGIGLWLLATPDLRIWLRRPVTWAAAALAAACFAPVLAWNALHGWASFAKQGGRTEDWNPARAAQFLGELVLGQAGLATPLVFLLCMAGVVLAVRRAAATRDPGWTLLACLTTPPLLVFAQHAVGDRVQGNWPAIVYPAAAVAAAGLSSPFWLRLRLPAAMLGGALGLLVYLQAIFAPVPLAAIHDPTLLRLGGWNSLAAEIDSVRREQGAAFIAADGYGPASELAWHLPADAVVVGVDPRWALFALPDAGKLLDGRVGLLVRSARRGPDLDPRPWAEITEIGTATRARDGLTAEAFRLYRVRGRASGAAVAVLPRPR